MTSEIKEQVEEILSFCSNNTGERFIGRRLCALLRDLDAEPPKPTGYKNRVQVCPECNIDMYQDISTKNAGFWVWYCPECGQEIKIT